MLLECDSCHQPYDIDGYKPGQRLRCRCGQILKVPKKGIATRVVRTMHCSSCGGQIERGRANCPFCNELVDQHSARQNAYCPSCLAMSREDARFCSGCGQPIVSVLDEPRHTDHPCPRCKVHMRRRTVGEHEPLECPMCCGLFVEADDFEQIVHAQEERHDVDYTRGPERSALPSKKVIYIPCPFCGEIMNRTNYGGRSGVIIDYCHSHGYWLDPGELEGVARWLATGGKLTSYTVNSNMIRDGRASLTETPPQTPTPASPEPEPEPEPDRASPDESVIDMFLSALLGRR